MTTTEPDAAEPIEVELVDDQPSLAIERAPAPVSMPPGPVMPATLSSIPDANELQTLAQMANTFAHSKLVPAALQDKPEDCFLVLLTARELGLAVTSAFRECHPIDGRMTVSPKMRLAMVRQLRAGRVWGDPENNAEHHTWHAARSDDPQTVYSVTYTLRDAVRAGLWMADCSPDDHSEQCQRGWAWNASKDARRLACKQNWRQYPGQMLQWRCIGYLMDQAFGEVGVGLYSADELGAVTDEDGRVIDIMEVGPLDGMPDHTPQPREPGTDPNDVCPEEVRAELKDRIYRLPHPAIEILREQWARRQQDDTPMLWPLPALPNRQVKSARALVAGFETRAEKGEWGPWNPAESATDSDPKGGTSPSGDPGTPPEPANGDGPQSAPAGDGPPYDPTDPPSDVLEAAIDRAQAIPDDELDAALTEAGQAVIERSKPETKRKRLCQAWFIAGWTPEPTDA